MGSCIRIVACWHSVEFLFIYWLIWFYFIFKVSMRHEETTRGVTRPFYYYIWNTKKKFDPSAVKHAMALCYVTTTLTRELYIIEFSNRFLLYVCKRHCVCVCVCVCLTPSWRGIRELIINSPPPPPPHTPTRFEFLIARALVSNREKAREFQKIKSETTHT